PTAKSAAERQPSTGHSTSATTAPRISVMRTTRSSRAARSASVKLTIGCAGAPCCVASCGAFKEESIEESGSAAPSRESRSCDSGLPGGPVNSYSFPSLAALFALRAQSLARIQSHADRADHAGDDSNDQANEGD